MNCSVCDKPLTGGIDTFGELGTELCMEHFFAPPPPTEDDLRIAELNDELDALADEIEDLEDQLRQLKDDQYDKEKELDRLQPAPKPTKVILKPGRVS